MEKEIWKAVPFQPFDLYFEISNHGNLKKLGRTISQKACGGVFAVHQKEERILKRYLAKKPNCLRVMLKIVHKGKLISKTVQPHRLCAMLYVKNNAEGIKNFVSFKDGNCMNTYYKNLEWVTQQEILKRTRG